MTSPHVVLPSIVGSVASLNFDVALVGRSGEAKSAAMRASADWLKVEPNWSPSKPGSGERLAKCFAYNALVRLTRLAGELHNGDGSNGG